MLTSTRPDDSCSPRADGLTVIELLITIVVLGVLSGVVVFDARGISNQGKTTACNAHRMNIEVPGGTYFAQYNGCCISLDGDLREVSPNFQTGSGDSTLTPTLPTKCI